MEEIRKDAHFDDRKITGTGNKEGEEFQMKNQKKKTDLNNYLEKYKVEEEEFRKYLKEQE